MPLDTAEGGKEVEKLSEITCPVCGKCGVAATDHIGAFEVCGHLRGKPLASVAAQEKS